jgi:hypothetical protein
VTDLEFASEELQLLRSEILSHVAETLRLEAYAVAGVVGFYAWVLTHSKDLHFAPWVWYVPVILPLAGGLRCLAIYAHMGTIVGYLLKVEAKLVSDTNAIGWEHHLNSRRTYARGAIAAMIWFGLLGATVKFSYELDSHSRVSASSGLTRVAADTAAAGR